MNCNVRSLAARALAASVCLFAAAGARAECPAGTDCAPTPEAGLPVAPATEPAVKLSPEQIAIFARITKSTEGTVRRRLQSDPELPALALSATEAYTSRKNAGKTLAILGGVILVVGDVVGAAMMVSAPGYPAVDESGQAQFTAGLGVAMASFGVGLALGIPGIVNLAKRSPEERAALRHYRQRPEVPVAKDRTVPPPAVAGAPLLSFSF